MEIVVAASAGYCFGVRRAVRIAEETAEKYGGCATFGPLIHNADAVRALEEKGVRVAEEIGDIREGEAVVIRSHGVPAAVYAQLAAKKAVIVDATCPDVARIHALAKSESEAGRTVVVLGERRHPEVIGIVGWCSGALVFETPEETEDYFRSHPGFRDTPVSVVSQTTAERSVFERSVKIIKKQCTNYKIFDTICNTTSKRQQEAEKIASGCDAMVVVGGRHSANTAKLCEICRRSCGRVLLVENADELGGGVLAGARRVGLTAGASTPAWIIKEVNRKMSDEIRTAEAAENTEAAKIEETAAQTVSAPEASAVPEENTAEKDAPSEDATFEELLERSIKTLHTGEKVSGIIAAISPTEISVDLGTKQSGYIPVAEFSDDPAVKPEDAIKVGDQIEAYVMRVNDVEGTVMLSKKRLDSVKVWDDICDARTSRAVVEGTVVEDNKGGVVVNVKGVRVFVPASQSGLPKDAPMTELLKKKVRLRITEVNQPRRRVVGSIRAVAYEERRERAEKIWEEIEVGKHYHGVVKSLTSYGAFVDIGGIDGMVHVSELSWKRIHQPSDVVSVGDEIDVYVISFDKEKKRISLGYKDPNENPWLRFTTTYQVGSVADVRIVKLMPFGAFAEIVPGVDGLIHISQIADRRIGKPEDVLSEGQEVQAKIINIDNDKQKVSLSIRALLERQNGDEQAAAPASEEPVVVYDTDNPPAAEEEPAASAEAGAASEEK